MEVQGLVRGNEFIARNQRSILQVRGGLENADGGGDGFAGAHRETVSGVR